MWAPRPAVPSSGPGLATDSHRRRAADGRVVMQGNGAECLYRDGTAFTAVGPMERPAYAHCPRTVSY
jgi:hypothetical protein